MVAIDGLRARARTGVAAFPLRRWLRDCGRWLAGSTALLALVLLIWWPTLAAPLVTDVGVYATMAQRWAHGDTLYRDVTTARPQGIFVVYRAIAALGLHTPTAMHAFALVWCLACTLLLVIEQGRQPKGSVPMSLDTLTFDTYVECDTCNGHGPSNCPTCFGMGFLSKFQPADPDEAPVTIPATGQDRWQDALGRHVCEGCAPFAFHDHGADPFLHDCLTCRGFEKHLAQHGHGLWPWQGKRVAA